ncbi:kelch domain-containing protein 10 homolog [Drosophila tropicalis]|uniref:kelch domain-containing protein 10 homolog n=1 Tax=Drosophila tropicalis TaxID=46794 RepID=UPI0035AC2754
MQIIKLIQLKCIILSKLRHTWTHLLVVVARLLDRIYHTAVLPFKWEPQPNNNNNNNNNNHIMEQDLPEDEHGQQEDQPQGNANFIARMQAIAANAIALAEPMDAASDLENEDADDMDEEEDEDDVDVDYDDSDSDSDFEEVYTDESTDEEDNVGEDGANRVRSKNAQEMLFNSDQMLQQQHQQFKLLRPYSFQPLRLVKCHYKEKHSPGGFPLARSGHRIIASNSHLYSLGGYNPRSASVAVRRNRCLLFQELWSYNFATNRWKLELNEECANNMPVELASNALTIHNNVLISHGGTGYPFGESCSNDCYVYCAGNTGISGVERLKVTGDLPTAQYGPGIVIHKHYLYTIGGTTGFDYTCDVYRLDLRTRVWENVYISRPEMRDDPEGRYRHEVVYDGKHIFVLGGGTSQSVYDLQRIPAYNLDANCWNYFDTYPDRSVNGGSVEENNRGYPKPRKCFSCVQHTLYNGDIEAFITGGLQGDFCTYFSDIWKLNLRTKQWTLIITASLPRPLYFHSAAHSDNGCMYVFGGIEYNEKEMRRRNDLYKMWMTVPKLSEMCWDAVTYYNENLDCFDRQSLLRAGIPKCFVQRLPPQRKKIMSKDEAGGSMVISLSSNPKRARPTMH